MILTFIIIKEFHMLHQLHRYTIITIIFWALFLFNGCRHSNASDTNSSIIDILNNGNNTSNGNEANNTDTSDTNESNNSNVNNASNSNETNDSNASNTHTSDDSNSGNSNNTNGSGTNESNGSGSDDSNESNGSDSNDSNESNGSDSGDSNESNGSDSSDSNESNGSGSGDSNESNGSDSNATNSTCTSTPATELAFSDTFVSDEHNDIDFSESETAPLTVEEIAAAFNTARAADPTITTQLQMPTQSEWDTMSESKKALYLINSERCDRGLIPYEGIEPKVVQVAQDFADYIAANNNMDHEADGRTPWERLAQDARVNTGSGGNADFFSYAENLAYQAVSPTTNSVYAPTARSVYWWMYEDKGSAYGHRKFILATGLNENSGNPNMEGVIGIGQASNIAEKNGKMWNRTYTVLNAFDPNGTWDLSNIER
jgi:hypothetical protein